MAGAPACRVRRSGALHRPRARGRPVVLADARRPRSYATGSRSCRWQSSWPQAVRGSSAPTSCSSGFRSDSTSSRATGRPTRASRHCARRSNGRTTSWRRTNNASSDPSPSSSAAARSRRPRPCAAPTPTRSSRSSTRASSASVRPNWDRATGCSRRFANSLSSDWTRAERRRAFRSCTPTTTWRLPNASGRSSAGRSRRPRCAGSRASTQISERRSPGPAPRTARSSRSGSLRSSGDSGGFEVFSPRADSG